MTKPSRQSVNPHPRRRPLRIILITLVSLVVVVLLTAIGFVVWTNNQIERVPEQELPSLDPVVSSETHTFLVVGTDDRSTLPSDFDDVFGDFPGERTDTIILINFTLGESAQIMSIPRDLRVEIPGTDDNGLPIGTNRINAAFAFGGPELLIATIGENLGIAINHYMEIDLAGFAKLVDAVDGVSILFEHAARDETSGLNVGPGIQTLNGEQALAYVRSRKYQEYRNEKWVTVGGNDIGRTRRQQKILLNLFEQVAARKNVFNLPRFAHTFAQEVKVDAGLSLAVIIELGRTALELPLSNIDATTLPVIDFKGEDGKAYVIPSSEAEAYLASFRSKEPLPN